MMRSLLLGIIGGVLAAVVGGFVWAGIVIATRFEIGFMATGIGLLSGFAVVWFSRGGKGALFQFTAILSSISGIALGKYLIMYSDIKTLLAAEIGKQTAANLPLFSKTILQFMSEGVTEMIGFLDIIWVVLAVLAAWRIPKK